MEGITHRFVETNGIRMHIAEKGEGPLVVMGHGFPESWYSWRHQVTALAEAGYHAVAPDQRGYGQTDRPGPIEAYNILQLTGDIVGLVHALGEEQAVIVGHDWGAHVASHCALLRPDIFRAVVLLSVPYLPRSWKGTTPTEAMRKMPGDKEFYQLYFQKPGRAEAEMEADVRRTMTLVLYSNSGSAPAEKRWRYMYGKSEGLLDNFSLPETLPPWLTEQDIDFFTGEFERTRFTGGLNWYRNIDRNWELTPFLNGAKIRQPALFVGGETDGVLVIYRKFYEELEKNMPNLKGKIIIPGVGHWVNQEQPGVVNEFLLEFLTGC